MRLYEANLEFFKMKEFFKGDQEWEKALALFQCITLKDRNTAEHSIEVGYFAAKIASKLELKPSRYFLAGLLHDIGKIGMNDQSLKTGDILTKKEREKLKDHVLHGFFTLSDLGFGEDIIQFCLRHHERLNGSGYPLGVTEDVIPIEGKIAQVADAFSAMTSFRKYRENQKVYSYEEALAEMKQDTIENDTFDITILTILEEVINRDLNE